MQNSIETAPAPANRPAWEPRYRRQYVGILVNGQRVIFANFFCNAYDTDWQHEIVVVDDGGSCYFEVKYDVQTGAFYDLSIHGEA